MIHLLVGTNRKNSLSAQVAKYIKPLYEAHSHPVVIMNLAEVGLEELGPESYGEQKPEKITKAVNELLETDGLVVICPEYNGSMPGALKSFIDHWKYPDSFEYRPVAFIGLGGMFGGLRPVEHLQQVFGYRNAFIFPDRVFLRNVWTLFQEGQIKDELIHQLLSDQALGFSRFIKALQTENLNRGVFRAKD